MDSILSIQNISKSYGSEKVLDVSSLDLKRSESFGLVGNNGAGKTTLFRVILDLIKPDSGEVTNNGVKVSQSEDWKNFTGSFLDEGFLIDYLTPDEYFEFIGKLHGLGTQEVKETIQSYEDFFKGEIIGKRKYIRDLSKGNQKKVGIVGALLGKPDVLLLDEPFANLDPSTQYNLRDKLKQLDEETEMTMLISSHDLGHVTEFCQRIVILDHGSVVKDIHTTSQTLKELEDFFVKKVRGAELAEE
jgi:ABC-2 type transport system ATP-binding protein